jgi:tetratricopeptide (TPR) repeat protein
MAVNFVGLARLYRGEYAAALLSFQRALENDIRLQDASGEITRLNNISNVYFFQGKYLDALQVCERALQRADQTTAEKWNPSRRQLTLANLATLYEQLGQNEKALDYYKLAQAHGPALPPAEQAQLLSNLGTLYRRMGDPAKALEIYQTARRLFSQGHHSDGQIHILHNIGIALALDFQDSNGALQAFSEALRLAEATTNRRQITLGRLFRGEALYRRERFEDARKEFELGLTGAREIGATEEQWTAQYGLGRILRRANDYTRALESFRQAIATIESVRSGLGSSSLKSDFLADKRDVYDACIDLLLQRQAETPAEKEQLFALFEQARARNLQDTLRTSIGQTALAGIQERLAPRSLMIEYWMSQDRIAAFWIAKRDSGVVTRPITARDLETIQEFSQTLQAAHGSSWKDDAARIADLLLSGLPASAMGPIDQLIIVPDGPMHYLPFELLSVDRSSPLLVERFDVCYLPVAALLLKEPPSQGRAPPWRRQLVAFGDPVVAEHGALKVDERWSRLRIPPEKSNRSRLSCPDGRTSTPGRII